MLDRRVNENRNTEQIIGPDKCARSNVVPYANDQINTTAWLLTEIKIQLFTHPRNGRKVDGSEGPVISGVDNVAFELSEKWHFVAPKRWMSV